jgi:hypothetical protein
MAIARAQGPCAGASIVGSFAKLSELTGLKTFATSFVPGHIAAEAAAVIAASVHDKPPAPLRAGTPIACPAFDPLNRRHQHPT